MSCNKTICIDKKVFSDSELQEDSVIRNFRIAAADSKTYNTKHYKLPAIIAVGYKDRLFKSDFDRALKQIESSFGVNQRKPIDDQEDIP